MSVVEECSEIVTASYRPPELFDLKLKQLDCRTDIWSLGCCFYALLYGNKAEFDVCISPFDGSFTAANSGSYNRAQFKEFSLLLIQ